MFSMNRLSTEKRAAILGMLVEGNSLRATTRMAGCSINTVSKLLLDIGEVCAAYQDEHLRDLPCKVIEADEIWSFVYSKQKNVPKELQDTLGVGDIWTWTALDADSKLIVSWYVGDHKYEDAAAFMLDLKGRLRGRIQLTTDGTPPTRTRSVWLSATTSTSHSSSSNTPRRRDRAATAHPSALAPESA
jgi:hypothetical protein